MRIISWNVNGIRAIAKKGFLEWLEKESPDILCIQETKAHPEQLTKKMLGPGEYTSAFSSAERKGYSGVALYFKEKPEKIEHGFGIQKFDAEGRIIIAHYPQFVLYNIYYPNGKQNKERLQYKLDFYDAFLEHANELKNHGKNLIITGDVNTAHQEIDLARPKENENSSGFLPVEREWMSTFLAQGYIDVFRNLYPEKVEYSWWDYKTRARERNVGWRIDYFFVTADFMKSVDDCSHLHDVMGSDHCPVSLLLR